MIAVSTALTGLDWHRTGKRRLQAVATSRLLRDECVDRCGCRHASGERGEAICAVERATGQIPATELTMIVRWCTRVTDSGFILQWWQINHQDHLRKTAVRHSNVVEGRENPFCGIRELHANAATSGRGKMHGRFKPSGNPGAE